jgi:neuronal guanine nucleotide exchange factor
MIFHSLDVETISPQQRKLQEAKFELITSEASYLRSLNVLTTHFIQSREFAGDSNSEALLSRLERHTLFSDIVPVRECSEALLADLEQRWQENVFIREICDILLEHASKHFEVYIKYCTNQLYQERMLRDLK